MKTFSLELKAPINGIYLNSETIELLSIIQCETIDALEEFAINCSQLNLSKQDVIGWRERNLEDIKKDLVEQYKNTLVSMEQSIKDKTITLKAVLEHSGITREEIDLYISTFQKEGYEGVKNKLRREHPEQYITFTEKAHRFIASERDQMKSTTYEELTSINNNISNHNTILVASGRYYNVTKKMYDEQIPDMEKYDFYYPQRGLDFCYRNGMYVRYHTLLDKQTMEEHFKGKNKGEILEELQEYVKQSIDFISKYNTKHQIDGKGVITSIDLFNEMISFDSPYRNMWQELYGISIEELLDIFKYAQENKPDGVTYVYNEPFLEDPERRKAVIEQLKQINELAPGLIDTIGTQMHIEMMQDIDRIRECFYDLKKLEDIGIGTQITEFDMCLPERFMFDESGNISKKYSEEFIYNYKKQKMQEISKAINETGIKLEGITYWSISDTLDHNLERTNRRTFEKNLPRVVANTRYAGLYAVLEKNKIVSTQQLGQETLAEQMDIALLDEIEEEQASQENETTKQKRRYIGDVYMIDIKYANAYSEVLEILKYIPTEDYNKIPKNKINLFKKNANNNYKFYYNPNKTLDEQQVSKIAKGIIAICFRDYWSTETQREKILNRQKYDRIKLEEEKRGKYNPDKIFVKQNDLYDKIKKENAMVKVEKEKWYEKIVSILRKILNIKKY